MSSIKVKPPVEGRARMHVVRERERCKGGEIRRERERKGGRERERPLSPEWG